MLSWICNAPDLCTVIEQRCMGILHELSVLFSLLILSCNVVVHGLACQRMLSTECLFLDPSRIRLLIYPGILVDIHDQSENLLHNAQARKPLF
jgi:hypothetical protein